MPNLRIVHRATLAAVPLAPITSPKIAPSKNMKNQSAKKPVKPLV